MSENKKLLLRDNIQDTGEIPSQTGDFCGSPDIIVHEQQVDPKTFFKSNYQKDVNQPLKKGSMTNTIYARAKNISTTPLQGYIRVYASTSSLFMTPSQWVGNILKTSLGKEYSETGIIPPNEVGVTEKPFIFNATKNHNYCHVGYVTTTLDEVPIIPSDFNTYDKFIKWIKNNPHITLRNFNVINSEILDYEQVDDISNPSDTEERVIAFTITLKGIFPIGTRVISIYDSIGIHSEQTVSKLSTSTVFTSSGIIPANFKGDLITKVKLPPNTKWPSGGVVSVKAFVSISEDSIAMPYAVNLLHEPALASMNIGKLIHIGTCSTISIF